MSDLTEEGYRCIDTIIQQITDEGKLPSRILVEQEEAYYLLYDLCCQLNISLTKEEHLKVIPEVRKELIATKPYI